MVTFTYQNKEYDLPSLSISIEGEILDISKRDTFDKHGEAVRLFIELLPHNGGSFQDTDGNTVNIPARAQGINILTATATEIVNFLNSPPITISEALKSLIRRVLAWRFATEFNNQISIVSADLKTEYQLIANSTKSIEFLGESGFFDTVRLDGTKV